MNRREASAEERRLRARRLRHTGVVSGVGDVGDAHNHGAGVPGHPAGPTVWNVMGRSSSTETLSTRHGGPPGRPTGNARYRGGPDTAFRATGVVVSGRLVGAEVGRVVGHSDDRGQSGGGPGPKCQCPPAPGAGGTATASVHQIVRSLIGTVLAADLSWRLSRPWRPGHYLLGAPRPYDGDGPRAGRIERALPCEAFPVRRVPARCHAGSPGEGSVMRSRVA